MQNVDVDAMLGRSRDGLFVLDQNRSYIVFSEGCERITGFQRAEVLGQQCSCENIADCRDARNRSLSGALCPSLKLLSGEVESYRQRMRIRCKDGSYRLIETTYSALADDDGRVSCVVGIMRPVGDASAAVVVGETGPEAIDCIEDREVGGNGSSRGLLDCVLADVERREILTALRSAHGQRTRAARGLGISRSRLYRRMEALGINPRSDL